MAASAYGGIRSGASISGSLAARVGAGASQTAPGAPLAPGMGLQRGAAIRQPGSPYVGNGMMNGTGGGTMHVSRVLLVLVLLEALTLVALRQGFRHRHGG
jgi:hypothetical protein